MYATREPTRSGNLHINMCDLPVASDGVDAAVVSTERDVESNDSVAGLDELEVLLRNASLGSSAVEEELHLLEEPRLLVGVELRTEVAGVGAGSGGERLSCSAYIEHDVG